MATKALIWALAWELPYVKGQPKKKKRKGREIYFKILANIIVETGKYILQGMLEGLKQGKFAVWFWKQDADRNVSSLWEIILFLRSLTDWVRSTLIMEEILLYSEFSDYTVNLIHKDNFMETYGIVFEQISGCSSLANLTYKMNHYSWVIGSHSNLGTH